MSLLDEQTTTDAVDTETIEEIDGVEPAARQRSWFRRPVTLAATVIALGGLVVGGTLWSMQRTVTVTVDGQAQQVSTLSDDVAGALDSADLVVGEHDVLAPAATSEITDGSTITLNRGRLVTLTIDGVEQQVWTTARTVDEALALLGRDADEYQLSADRSREIPLDGIVVTAATLHTVTLTDGAAGAQTIETTAGTVAELLAERGLTVGPLDTLSLAVDAPIADGVVLTIGRTFISSVVLSEPVAQPADVTIEDPNLDRGTTAITVTGSAGTAAVTYRVTSVNGVETARVEASRITTLEPVATQISVGTKTTLRWEGTRVFFDDTEFGINWDSLAYCESTNVPTAVNAYPSAGLPTYGLFQFDLPTWQSVGGSGNPIDATPEEQIMRAKLLYQSRGLEPWACRDAA